MRWLRFVVLIISVTLLQAGLLSNLEHKPDLLVILVVFFSIYCDMNVAIIASFTIGFASDIIGTAMGPGTISFGVIGTIISFLHQLISIRKIPYQAIAIFVAGFLTGISIYYLNLLKGGNAEPNIYKIIFADSLFSGIVGPLFFLPIAWWVGIKTRRFTRR
jgi:rod shape-determining protein MreD